MKKRILIFLPVILCLLATTTSAIEVNVDSLQTDLRKAASGKNHQLAHDLALELGEHYYNQNDFPTAIKYYQAAFEHSYKNLPSEVIIQDLYKIGMCYQRNSNPETSIEYLFKIIEKKYGQPSPEMEAKAYARISKSYQNLGDFSFAFEYQVEALKIRNKLQDSIGMAKSIYEIGTIFFYQESFDNALEKYVEALKIFEKVGERDFLYNCLAAIGSTYERLGKYPLALKYSKDAMDLAAELGKDSGIGYSAHNVGSTHVMLGDYEKGLNYLEESLRIFREINDSWGQIGSLRSIANLYIKSNQGKKALPYLERAMEITESIGSKSRKLEIQRYFATAYRQIGDMTQACNYLEEYVSLKDSVTNDRILQKMGKKNSAYEIQKREQEISLLKRDKELLKKDQQIQELYKYILISAAFFLSIMLSMFYSRYRGQKNSNRILEEKSLQIQIQNKQLEDANQRQAETNKLLGEKNLQLEKLNLKIQHQNEALENSNDDLKQFAYVASHDLKEPLRMIGSYTSLLKRRYESMFDDNAQEFMGYITDAVGRMEILLNDLLSYSRVNTQQQTHDWFNSIDAVDMVLANLRLKINEQNVKVNVDREAMPRVKASRSQMVQLMQNLMSNGIKFSKTENPEITIGATEKENHIEFFIKDNGIGISEENQSKIFEMFRRLHSRQEYEGSGIGLATCKKIVEKHRGSIRVESKPGEGSTFFFSIQKMEEPGDDEKISPNAKKKVASMA